MRISRVLFIGFAGLLAAPALAEETGTALNGPGSARERLFKRPSDLSLSRFSRTGDSLALFADEAWRRVLEDAGLSVSDAGDRTYRVNLDSAGLEMPKRDHAALAIAGLPTRLDDVVLDMVLSLSKDPAPEALANGAVTRIDLARIELGLGPVSLSGEGQARADEDGRLQGEIGLSVENWREALALPAFAGVNAGGQLESALEGFASGDTLNVTLRLVDGSLKLGPLELARLPKALGGI